MHALVATGSVHATAAACDHLAPRLSGDDAVTVAAVGDPDVRDAGDAANVATARLAAHADIETTRIEAADDEIASAVLAAARERGVDELLLDAGLGTATATGVSDAVSGILGRASVPVIVVPREP